MITLTVGIDQNVIYEDNDEHIQVLLEHAVHQVHKSCRGIGKTKGYNWEFKVTIPSTESYFWNVTFSDSELVIARSEFYLREIAGTLKLVKQVIDSRKRILVLDRNFIELQYSIHILRESSFLHTNKTGAPHGEILGLMNLLSSPSTVLLVP
ncbi:hypothetical protein T459_25221 [Capsicum annuum]|uniref:Uncharacterized protein n=1 Tax=Capsicum annuum TaxID=4072 RepID=A0A2G2YK48_CAPAN|nr:hypothetical protein T459_25221 [Capsicum annuum]